jgi:hypothetical protein
MVFGTHWTPHRKVTHTSGSWSWDSDSLWSKVVKQPGCWHWSGSNHHNAALFGGYKNGISQMTQVRRLIWAEVHNIADIDELAIRHLCQNKLCCNPAHLYETPNNRKKK